MEYILPGIVCAMLIFIFSMFRPAATSKIEDNLYSVRCLFVNFYILRINDSLILFDTGISKKMALRGFAKLKLSPDSVTHIFLTHSDRDHAGGAAAFPDALLILPAGEEQMINGKKARRLFIYNKKPKEIYQLTGNNDILEIGGVEIKTLPVPGHTPGSVIYLINEEICVCGDLLRITRKRTLKQFMRLMNMNHKQNRDSFFAVAGILNSSRLLLSGHTGYLKKG